MNNVVQIIIKAKDAAGATIRKVKGDFKDLSSSVTGFLGSFQGMMASLGISLAGGMITKFLVDTNREFESLMAQLKVLEGSEAGARKTFDALSQFAKDTPFQLNEVTEAYIKLRGAGIAPTLEEFKNLGDLASARGKTIKDMAMAVEDAVTGEFERLKEFGIKARQNGDMVTMTFNGQSKTIRNTQQEVVKFLEAVGQMKGVAGSMEGQMSTLNGKFSNLMDNLEGVARIIGEQGGVNDLVKDGADSMLDFTDALVDNADKIAGWSRVVVSVIRAITQTLIFVPRIAWNVVTNLSRLFTFLLVDFTRATNRVMAVGFGAYAAVKEFFGLDASVARGKEAEARAWESSAAKVGATLAKEMDQDLTDIAQTVYDLGSSYLGVTDAVKKLRAETRGLKKDTNELPTLPGTKPTNKGDELSKEDQKRLDRALANFDPWGFGLRYMGIPKGGKDAMNLKPVATKPQGGQMSLSLALFESISSAQTLNQVIADMTTNTMRGFGDAVSDAFAAMVDGSKSAGEAFKDAMLGALGAVARGFGDFYMAKAIGALAEGIGGNPAAFASAAKYTAAATAMYAVSGALSGFAGRGGGGSHASHKRSDDLAGNAQKEAVLVVEGGLLDMSDPRQASALARALENLSGRRVTVRGG